MDKLGLVGDGRDATDMQESMHHVDLFLSVTLSPPGPAPSIKLSISFKGYWVTLGLQATHKMLRTLRLCLNLWKIFKILLSNIRSVMIWKHFFKSLIR